MYLDKEDDVLDYSKRVVFAHKGAPGQRATIGYEEYSEDPSSLDRSTFVQAEDESNMTFDDSQDPAAQSGYTLLLEHNYPIKQTKPLKDLSDEERERVRLVASFKDMKNMDYKAKGLWFRVTVIHRGRKIQCERRFKEFEYLRVAL